MPDYKPKSITLVQGVLAKESFVKIKQASPVSLFLCEGRPSLAAGQQNSKGFLKQGIVPTIICDNMAGFLFYKGWVKDVYLTCQYADSSGALCDCGALICAVLAKRHKIPVKLLQGELRSRFLGNPKDIVSFEGTPTAPKGTNGYVPLVEWVPAKYLS